MTDSAVKKSSDNIWTPEQIQTIKDTVAIGANDSELKMFLSIASKYELDPFLREIWFANMGNRNIIMTGRDGYLKIANRNPNFDGITSDVVHANDKFLKEGDLVKHAYNVQNRGVIIGAYAIVYRKDRTHPVFCYAPFNEYNKGGRGVWGQYPSAMIMKVAESMALKRAFSISGLVTEEELSDIEESRETQPAMQTDIKRKQSIQYLWNQYLKTYGENARAVMGEITGKNKTADYTDEDIKKLSENLIQKKQPENQENETPVIIDAEEVTTSTTQEGNNAENTNTNN